MICPTCGQRLPKRGVELPRVKSLIFDAIKAAGDIGITTQALLYKVYDEDSMPCFATIKAHVYQINEIIGDTGLRIISEQDDRKQWHWVLIKRREKEKEHGTRARKTGRDERL